MLCGLIMAGGQGSRLFPLSTDKKPKQFLELYEKNSSMLQSAFKRLCALLPIERIFVVTTIEYAHYVREQLPLLAASNIIEEPISKNTSACILLSALRIKEVHGELSNLVIIPSDQLIMNEEKLYHVLRTADQFITENNSATIIIGVPVLNANSAYGYIKCSLELYDQNNLRFYKVDQFVEKPGLEKARLYYESKDYFWNTGISVWAIKTILEMFRKYLPSMYTQLLPVYSQNNAEQYDGLYQVYNNIESISIDCAILEKSDNCFMIHGQFGWDDLGSWPSLERNSTKDDMNNILIGDIKVLLSSNNIVCSTTKPVVVSNVSNIIVVDTDDFIFIGNKEDLHMIHHK